jgi:apolipoprotein N-acyltransferase
MSKNAVLASLVALSALLLSVPFLVPGTGFLALVAFVPLLFAEEIATSTGMKGFFKWHYACFVLWNAATTFWVCNATVGGGIFAILANSLWMSGVFGLFRWSRKHLGGALSYLFLAFAWISWERFYLTWSQISWPWLVLGNAFARTTGWIQWYEFTGTLGGSLWVWATNLSIFGIIIAFCKGGWQKMNVKARSASLLGVALLLTAPPAVSLFLKPDSGDGSLKVVIAQPNIDPYNKFGGMSQKDQNQLLLSQFESVKDCEGTLLIGPETFTPDVVTNDLSLSPTIATFQSFVENHPGTNMLFGASSRTFVRDFGRPSQTARPVGEGSWIETHNSSLMLSAGHEPQIYHKSKLVVAVEMMPYPWLFRPLDELLGGVMGRSIGQDEVTNLHLRGTTPDGSETDIPVGSAICYESIYGEYCTEYVRKGARLLTVITNDAWWKDTPGYRQHLSYSSLRAIETRRWIARCANTGVSAIIDPSGNILKHTSWWQPEVISGEVGLSSEETFFVKHGDFVGRISLLMFVLMFFGILVRKIVK